MNNHVYWVFEVNIKDGEFDNFKQLTSEMVEATKANEPDALNFEFTISEDGKSCHIYERYADSAATMVHLGNFGENFAERFMAMAEPTRFVVYGKPNSDVKQALDGMDAVFMTPLGGFAQ